MDRTASLIPQSPQFPNSPIPQFLNPTIPQSPNSSTPLSPSPFGGRNTPPTTRAGHAPARRTGVLYSLSMRRRWFWPAWLLILLVIGCAEPPTREMDQAQGAIDAAKAAGAEKYAADEYTA